MSGLNNNSLPWLIPPWKHQEETFERAKDFPEYALFFEMGCGKSLTLVQFLRWRFKQAERPLRTLIFCPPAVRNNWYREIMAGSKLGSFAAILDGSFKKRIEKFYAAKKAIYITNYESLQDPELFGTLKSWMPEVLVFDESQRLKSGQAKRTKKAIELADVAKYKYILSGSPILNSSMDIWAQYRVLDGGKTFDKNFYAFRAKYFYDKNAGMPKQKYFPDWRPYPGIEADLTRLIYQKASRVLKKDCLDLPPLVRKTVDVEMSSEQARMYGEMAKGLVTYLNDRACVATIALTKILRMQQIVSGFYMDDEGVAHAYNDNPRLALLVELLEELCPEHKVIVWCAFRENYSAITKELDGKFTYQLLVGGMSDKVRQNAIDSFQEDKNVRVLIANQSAGGVGINLTASDYAIYFSRGYSLEADIQSEARNHRGGSEIHQSVTRVDIITPKSIDEVILKALLKKENLAELILSKEFKEQLAEGFYEA